MVLVGYLGCGGREFVNQMVVVRSRDGSRNTENFLHRNSKLSLPRPW